MARITMPRTAKPRITMARITMPRTAMSKARYAPHPAGAGSIPSDRHAASADSNPRFGKGFFSLSHRSVQILFWCPYTPLVTGHSGTGHCSSGHRGTGYCGTERSGTGHSGPGAQRADPENNVAWNFYDHASYTPSVILKYIFHIRYETHNTAEHKG